MKNRIISLILCFCMVVMFIPAISIHVDAAESTVFNYVYNVSRSPAFPSAVGGTTTISSHGNPYGQNIIRYPSAEGKWTLTEAGPYSKRAFFSPIPTNSNLGSVVSAVARAYSLSDAEKDTILIHKLTDKDGALVAYGVVVGYSSADGRLLFIGDALGGSGAGYILTDTEITSVPFTFTADRITQTASPVLSVDTTSVSFDAADEGYTVPEAKKITVLNTGSAASEAVYISLSKGSNSSFTVSRSSLSSVAAGGNAHFTVVPKANLAAGTHSDTITLVSNSKTIATINVSFTVNEVILAHSHSICGDSNCEHSPHSDFGWTEWTSSTSLPSTSGNYFLTQDVILSSAWSAPNMINICLNGHEVRYDDEVGLIALRGNCDVSITDCAGDGILFAPEAPVVSFSGNRNKFHLYSGTISSVNTNTILDDEDPLTNNIVSIHGGTVMGVNYPAIGTRYATVNLYGGKIQTEKHNGIVIMPNSYYNFAGDAVISGSNLSDNTISNDIKVYGPSLIDAEFYTGGTHTVYYANTSAQVGDIVVMNVNDRNADKFILSAANAGYMLKREGNNLVYTEAPVIPTYTVTFNANGGAVTPSSDVTDTNGKLTSLPTPTRSGEYNFAGWFTAANGGNAVTLNDVYTADATIYAHWTYTGSTSTTASSSILYTIKFDSNGGSAVENRVARRNRKLSEPAAPNKDGYIFKGWYTDNSLTTAYDFDSLVRDNFTLYAKWEKASAQNTHNCPSKAFYDLDTTAWYHLDTDYVIENGIFKGVTGTKFAPNDKLTRAMLVTVLYRVENEPATNRSIPFADLDMSAYYANAVIWAQQNGIVKGISETEFAPNAFITREQIAAIMFRYAQYKGMDAVTIEENLHFTDADEISEYAVSAMNWAVGTSLIKGKSDTTINPKDNATRAEIAAILHRFIENK